MFVRIQVSNLPELFLFFALSMMIPSINRTAATPINSFAGLRSMVASNRELGSLGSRMTAT